MIIDEVVLEKMLGVMDKQMKVIESLESRISNHDKSIINIVEILKGHKDKFNEETYG